MTLADRLEQIRKFLLIVGPLVVAVWTVWEFSASARIEARKPFLERQLELCFEATRVAAIIATTTDEERWKIAKGRFWELYWGELVVVENNAVKTAMNSFYNNLKEWSTLLRPLPLTELESPDRRLTVPDFETLSLVLGKECRNLIADSWGTELEPLSD